MPGIRRSSSANTTELSGRRVVVTGAGSGIGRAAALAFAQRGAQVIATDLNRESAEVTGVLCNEQANSRTTGAHYGVDVADWDAMVDLAERVLREHGPVDVLVNNAGVGMTGRLADMSVEDWRWIRSINLDGVLHGCKAFGPAMIERGSGHVVNVSSGLGYTPTAEQPAYGTTKAAVLALSLALRADWQEHGIGVSAICPGVINTPIIDSTRFAGSADDPDARAKVQKLFNRGHKPELVADAIIEAVARNRAVVPVGWEARLGWFMHRFAPLAAQQAIARRRI